MPDPAAVNSMFGRIAGRYDLANHLLSGGVDGLWRRRLVAAARRRSPADVVDLATGSGDVAFALARALPPSTRITGIDFCAPMLAEAERKKICRPHASGVIFRQGDALDLPLPGASTDVITLAFGLRNMADRGRALREIRRVLRPQGGTLLLLEFSQPHAWFRPAYYAYLRHVLPRLAGWITGDKSAYDYLCGSIGAFPERRAVDAEILAAGYSSVTSTALSLGIVALHEARA